MLQALFGECVAPGTRGMTPEQMNDWAVHVELRVRLAQAQIDKLFELKKRFDDLEAMVLAARQPSQPREEPIVEGSVVWSRLTGEELVAIVETVTEIVEPLARGGARVHRVPAWVLLGERRTVVVPAALLVTAKPDKAAERRSRVLRGVLTFFARLSRFARAVFLAGPDEPDTSSVSKCWRKISGIAKLPR